MTDIYNFYVIPDLHMIPPTLNLTDEQRLDQRCMMETPSILNAVFDKVCADTETPIIIVPGDLTNSGEYEAHVALVEKLRETKGRGKRIYVISAAHDYCDKTRFEGSTPTRREQLTELYSEFMTENARSVAPDGFSYSARLEEGLFLLALNDDKKPEDGVNGYGFTKEVFDWIKSECEKAKERNDTIIAMTHHPLLPPNSLYPVIALGDLVMDWKNTAAFLADCGVEFMFTGHTHMQSINYLDTQDGNRIYDINTASVTGYPTCFRKVHLEQGKMDVETQWVDTYDWELGGLSANEYAYENFKRLLTSVTDSLSQGGDRFAQTVGIPNETARKLSVFIKLLGKVVDSLTIGGAGRLLGVSKYVDQSIKKTLVKDLIIDLILTMYHGDEPYTPDTPVYKAMNAVFEKLEKILTIMKKDEICEITRSLRGGFLYNLPPSDWDASLERIKSIAAVK